MRTYKVTSYTNYGEVIHIINATSLEDLENIVKANDCIWDNPDIEELDMSVYGVVTSGGGE